MLEENVWHWIRMVLVEGIMEKMSLKKLGKIIEINRILQIISENCGILSKNKRHCTSTPKHPHLGARCREHHSLAWAALLPQGLRNDSSYLICAQEWSYLLQKWVYTQNHHQSFDTCTLAKFVLTATHLSKICIKSAYSHTAISLYGNTLSWKWGA